MRVQDIMSKPVQTVAAGSAAAEAWERMRRERIHHLVVVEGKRIVGVISEKDLGGRRGAAVRGDLRVDELMIAAPVTIEPDTHLRQAAGLMRGRSIGCLPVCEQRRLVGILTVSDVLSALSRGSERPVERGKRWTLRHRGPRRHVADTY